MPASPGMRTVDVRHRNGVGVRIGLHAQNRDSERVACGVSENRDAAAVVLETLATVAASAWHVCRLSAIVPLILTGSGDAMPVVAMLCRVPGAMSVGMLAGTAVGGMTIRERQLFAYFKARA